MLQAFFEGKDYCFRLLGALLREKRDNGLPKMKVKLVLLVLAQMDNPSLVYSVQ